MVPLDGSRFKMSMRMVYDFATLKRMLGMSSVTSLSIIGRIAFSITSRFMAGASVYSSRLALANIANEHLEHTEMAKHVVIR